MAISSLPWPDPLWEHLRGQRHTCPRLHASLNRWRNPYLFDDSRALQNMLWQTCSLISGSIALAALLPYQLPTWNPQDIDIYTTEQSFRKVLAHVLTDGYTIMVDTTTNPKYPGPTSIALVVTLSGPKWLNLDIIVRCTKCALTLIFKYYGSHVINCITHHGLYSSYPYHTLANSVLATHPSSLQITSWWRTSYTGAWSSTPFEVFYFKFTPSHISCHPPPMQGIKFLPLHGLWYLRP